MFTVLLVWAVIFIVTYSLGLLANSIIQHYTSYEFEVVRKDMLVYNSLSGLCLLIALLSISSIFFRVNYELLFFFSLIATGVLWNNKERIKKELSILSSLANKSYLFWLIFALPFLFLWYNSMESPVSIGDTMLYHAQTIQWSEKYKVIPGLANLHNRLAFNNQSLLAFSLFGFTFTGIQTFYCVNSFLLLLLTIKCCSDITKFYISGQIGNLLLASSILVCSYFIFGERVASPAPDITTAILILFSAILFKEIYLDKRKELLPALYMVSFALPTIKLSTVFNMVLPVFISVKEKQLFKKNHLLALVGYGTLVFLPFIARHVIMSGYLVFPFPLDLFSFDWQYYDVPRLEMMNDVITNAARITGPHQKGLDTMQMSITEWFPYWLTFRSKEYYLMNGMLPITILFTMFSFLSFKRQQLNKNYFFLLFGVYFTLAFAFWLIKAPDYRFFWGTLIASFSFFLFFPFKNKLSSNSIFKGSLVAFSLLIFLGLFANRVSGKKLKKHLLYPMTVKTVKVKKTPFQGITINVPSSKKLGGLCWNAPVPCTHSINWKLELRGEKLSDGFRLNHKKKRPKKKKVDEKKTKKGKSNKIGKK